MRFAQRSVAPLLFTGTLLALSTLATGPRPILADDANWPQFRGHQARGVATTPVPTTWNVETGDNIRWKTPIPGLGLSSPVVWGKTVILTTARSGSGTHDVRTGLYGDIAPVNDTSPHRYQVLAIDTETGEIRWQRTAHTGVPQIKRHTKSSHANPTPATDGERVVAFFGSEGLYAYSMDGERQWKVDLGTLDSGFFMVPDAQWGFASSPVLHDGRVIVQCDIQKGSFIAALDARSGDLVWKTERDEVPTWSTPTVADGRVLANGWKHIGAYDLATGEAVWWLAGGGDIPVPTPIVQDGLAFFTNAHGPGSPILAIQHGTAKGDLSTPDDLYSHEQIAWAVPRGGAYMQTPILVGEHLYVCRDNGALSCYVAKTGERLYQERLAKGRTGFTASAVAAADHIYYTAESGEVVVVKAGPAFEVVARNELGEEAMATPAIADGTLYMRTFGHLLAIGET
ncbi:MAG: PQQ-binding-like beta-propeller repeat protein, partial [Acidobacteriota bacterium]